MKIQNDGHSVVCANANIIFWKPYALRIPKMYRLGSLYSPKILNEIIFLNIVNLTNTAYKFERIAVENLGVFSSTTLNFISELGLRICVHTGNVCQRLHTYSNAFLSCYNASTPCFCTTLCQLICRTYDHPTF